MLNILRGISISLARFNQTSLQFTFKLFVFNSFRFYIIDQAFLGCHATLHQMGRGGWGALRYILDGYFRSSVFAFRPHKYGVKNQGL